MMMVLPMADQNLQTLELSWELAQELLRLRQMKMSLLMVRRRRMPSELHSRS
jgi:hypothetical protein